MSPVGTEVKILVAPSAFKGTLGASTIAAAIAAGLGANSSLTGLNQKKHGSHNDKSQRIDIELAPIADGGDDSLNCLALQVKGCQFISSTVSGPTSLPVAAAYLKLGDLACIELARASGIAHLQKEELAPLTAHTYGLGQLIARAIDDGAREIVIFLGGSASTDGGAGALTALGARFVDIDGSDIARGGGALGDIAAVYLDELRQKTAGIKFYVATDVTNVLCGQSGAASIFAPQKGASAEQVALLDSNLAHYASVLRAHTVGPDVQFLPGAGAAGGAGFGLASILGAEIVSGFHWLAERTGLKAKIRQSDLIVVAEGALDHQSLGGKANGEILEVASRAGRPVVAIVAMSALSGVDTARFFKIIEAARPPYASGLATTASIEAAARAVDLTALLS